MDILITTTSSPNYIIKKESLEGVLKNRLYIIDLGVPKNVDPKVKEIKNVELFSLEDLTSVIKKNVERKKEEVKRVKEMISKEVGRLWEELIKLELEKVPLF